MASLKKVNRSPFWYIRRRDLETGAWFDENTKMRRDDKIETRHALRLCEKYSAAEQAVKPTQGENFSTWVLGYIHEHYARASTLRRNLIAWESISRWLRENRIKHPREVRYQHAQEFIAWRKQDARHNTARMELKFFAFILNEAIRREFCERNPLTLARVEREAPTPKPDISDASILKAREAFANAAEWMRITFEIMLHLGCRFAEASIPLADIDFEEGLISMRDSKRKETDPRKTFQVPMPTQLAEFLKPLRKRERTVPILNGSQNQQFNIILKRAIETTSHSLRVAFISRCHRSGLTEQEAMRLVNHSSRLVHHIYSRLNVSDAKAARLRVPLPVAPLPLFPKNHAPSE